MLFDISFAVFMQRLALEYVRAIEK